MTARLTRSAQHSLDMLEAEHFAGVDVTRLLGAYDKAEERLREAKAAVEDQPSLDRCREYVRAYDALQSMIEQSAKFGAAA